MKVLDYDGLSRFKDKNDALYARKDGYYRNLVAGQLASSLFEEDKVPYCFRTSGGSIDIGSRETDLLVGGTVAWNQLADHSAASKDMNGITFTNNNDGSWTVSGTASAVAHASLGNIVVPNGHIVLLKGCPSGGSTSSYRLFHQMQSGSPYIQDTGSGAIAAANGGTGDTKSVIIYVAEGTDLTVPIVFKPQLFDLTRMFGSNIAAYIYGLETANAGDGVAWFKKLFPKEYYAYNVGELLSVKTSEHRMVGFNAYDPSTGKAKVVGGHVYQITGTYTSLSLGGTSVIPDADGCFTPNASGELTVTGGNSTDTCIHLKWDGERDGEYEPYELHSYELDSDLILRGIPKLDSGNKLYYDGDTYESDGTVTRRLGAITFDGSSDESWVLNTDYNYYSIYTSAAGSRIPNCIFISTYQGKLFLCDKYEQGAIANSTSDCGINIVWGQLRVRLPSMYSTVDEWKTYLSAHPFSIIYELDEPTSESADPYTNPQIVDDFGTEEYVDSRDVPIPVGHETQYQANLRAKLEMAPDSPGDGDGDYLVKQSSGQNSYKKYTDGGRITALEAKIPSAPTAEGTYVLKCTVSDGTAAFAWTAET